MFAAFIARDRQQSKQQLMVLGEASDTIREITDVFQKDHQRIQVLEDRIRFLEITVKLMNMPPKERRKILFPIDRQTGRWDNIHGDRYALRDKEGKQHQTGNLLQVK